jgi:hypothetical protein
MASPPSAGLTLIIPAFDGAVFSVLFPPSLLATTVAAGSAGALAIHCRRVLAKDDLRELRSALGAHESALVVARAPPISSSMPSGSSPAPRPAS